MEKKKEGSGQRASNERVQQDKHGEEEAAETSIGDKEGREDQATRPEQEPSISPDERTEGIP